MHETLIYIDVYFISNYVMDAFLLVIFGWVINIKSSLRRILGTAFAGALLACIVLCLNSYIVNIIGNFIVSALMLFILLYKKKSFNVKEIVRYYVLWYFISFGTGGIFNYFAHDNLSIITMINLIVVCGITCYITVGRRQLNSIRSKNEDIYRVGVYKDKRSLSGYGYYDSGNSLIEPISRNPALVCEYDFIMPFLTKGEIKYINMFPNLPEEWDGKTRIRSIPYSSIGKDRGYLPGLPVDSVIIERDGKSKVFCKCYIAVINKQLSADKCYSFLLQNEMKLS